MATRAQIKEVHSVNFEQFNTRDIPKCLANTMILVVDNQRPPAHCVPSISHLTLKIDEIIDDTFGIKSFSKFLQTKVVSMPKIT